YAPPPATIKSAPILVPTPDALARAPINGGIEGLASLPNGRLLMLTEDFANSDGSLKGWLTSDAGFAEISYVPATGHNVTDCAALTNGDVIVLERRYRPLGIFSVRLALVNQKDLRPGAKLTGKELLRLEQPLAVENFEGLAVQKISQGTLIYLISDDNYNPFQQTLLLQFLLPDTDN
ncbi:MAG: esterase-like activity of phytase family protein, partial [Candidatus Binatia bacterium]